MLIALVLVVSYIGANEAAGRVLYLLEAKGGQDQAVEGADAGTGHQTGVRMRAMPNGFEAR